MPGIIERMIGQALAGDTGAARALLALSVPPRKAAEEPTPVELAGDTLTDQGRSVLAAVSAGVLAPGQGQALLSSLADLARLRAEDDHEERLARIEAAQAAQQGQST